MCEDCRLRTADGEDRGAREVGGQDRVAGGALDLAPGSGLDRAMVRLGRRAQLGPPTKALKVMSV